MIKTLGYERGTVSAHGLRSTFRSLAHEQLGIEAEVTELMLSHKIPGTLGSTYMRSLLLDQRKAAARAWGDYLDTLRPKPRDQTT
ncbi:putative prophage CPS-53 integrase [compost metagenome]